MIAALNVTHIRYTQLSHETWCATAKVSVPSRLAGFLSVHNKPYWFFAYSSYIASINLSKFKWYYYTLTTPTTPRAKRTVAHRQRQQQRQGVRYLLQQE